MALLTFKEAARQPICLILLSASLIFITLTPVVITHTLDETVRLITDSTLAVTLLTSFILAGIAASATIRREIRTGTALTVLSKPISRTTFFLAKFLGIALFVTAFCLAAVAAASAAHRLIAHYDATYQLRLDMFLTMLTAPLAAYAVAAWLNYTKRIPFVSMALYLHLAAFTILGFAIGGLNTDILLAGLLVSLAGITLAAIAVTASTRLEVTPTLAVLLIVFLAGMTADYLAAQIAQPTAAALCRALLPNWQYYWIADALHAGNRMGLNYIVTTGAYSILYTTGILFLGAAAFKHSEMK